MEYEMFLHYMFMPLNRHIDNGFGATGDAFYEAAEKLLNSETNFLNSNLPINFLFRHAIELYLKSLIIVIHRRFEIPFGDKPSNDTPSINIGNNWTPIYKVHSVNDLYIYFKKLIYDKKSQINSIAKTDWSAIPPEFDGWIELIENNDPMSTFYRYPVTRNQKGDYEKSSWKEISPDKLTTSLNSAEKPTKSYVLVDDNYNVVNAYQYDNAAMGKLHDALKKTADLLAGAHCGMRVELADGK
jgi:hypothetical protein